MEEHCCRFVLRDQLNFTWLLSDSFLVCKDNHGRSRRSAWLSISLRPYFDVVFVLFISKQSLHYITCDL